MASPCTLGLTQTSVSTLAQTWKPAAGFLCAYSNAKQDNRAEIWEGEEQS